MISHRPSLRPHIALLTAAVLACSGAPEQPSAPAADPQPPSAQGVVVAVTPSSATLALSAQQTFAASVTGTADETVTWIVAEGAAGGTVTPDGTYTAPATAGSYHLVATSAADPTKTTTVGVTVTAATPAPISVAVLPASAAMAGGRSQNFVCMVTGSTDTACTWSVQEGPSGGSVMTAGAYAFYTAPAYSGTYHLVAKSHADATKSATATVSVTGLPPPVAVSVSPTTATLTTRGSQTFTCSVTGSSDKACTWSVQEGASGGSVTSAGAYTAPATAGTYHVVAKSHADATKSATATVTVNAPPPVAVSVSPATATVAARGSQTFSCTVTGSSDTACTWSVQEGTSGGSVTTGGAYTAPATAGTYHVVAKSHADATKSATATVTVSAPPASVGISISPTTASVAARGSQTFTCTVTGSSDTACTWSVQEGASGGSVTTAGAYTAPATAGTYHVVATSHADATKSATATVTVSAPPASVGISISPTTASVDACATFTFSASVTGTSNTAVTWSVTESSGGSVSSSGVYTAPANGGTYHVVATSQADASKSQTATVTVAERIVSVSVAPGSTTVAPGGTVQFTATVTTTCGSFTQTVAAAN